MSKARFHFEIFWPKFDDFGQVVTDAWCRLIGPRGPLARLDGLLWSLVRVLQSWSATKIGGIKEQLLMAAWTWRKKCDSYLKQRTIVRQRSCIRHLSEGDANTAYFHLIARGRKHRNFIPSLNIDRHVQADHEGMEQALFEHFSAVFGTAASGGTTINFNALGIQPLQLADLEADIDAEGVWKAIRELPPGPDGFTGAFYKTAWPIIRDDVMSAVQAFTGGDHQGFDKLNNALIVLLTKKIGASCLVDFRPITIIHQVDLQDPRAEACAQAQ